MKNEKLYKNSRLSLLKLFADQSDKLFDLGIIRTDSFTGEIGEYIASKIFGFDLESRSMKSIDGIGKDGTKFQVKSKVVLRNNYSIRVTINKSKIDKLIIVYFNFDYYPLKIIEIDSESLSSNTVNISNKLLKAIDYIEYKHDYILSKINRNSLDEIIKFGKVYKSLLDNNIIRTRRIVGDIGEYYASLYMKLYLNENVNEKGVDAYDRDGRSYEIKTRRVYDSGRRKSDTRRLNNLDGKLSDYLVVVVLGKNFSCDGMWCMPMNNIKNKKSATLRIVNNTKGVKCIVPSKVSWLICE